MRHYTVYAPSNGLATVLLVVLMALAPGAARSALIQVTDLVDDTDTGNGTCTLREALRSANGIVGIDACAAGSNVVVDLIHLPPGIHIVDLSSANDEDLAVTGDLDVLGRVTIQGSSAEHTIIDGTGGGAIDRLFHVHDSADEVKFVRLTLRGGTAADTSQLGGVLWNVETGTTPVELVEVEVSGGTAAAGGGIANVGNLLIKRSRITGNQTTVNPGLPGNHGGGVLSAGMSAQLRIEDSEVSGNQAEEDGAGLWVGSGAFTLHRSTVAGNTAGGNGGGLFVSTTNYEVDYIEFSGNAANQGGGVYMAGTGEVQHSALVTNQATTAGGGLYDGFGGFARFSTIADNSAPTGAGVYANSGQTLLDSNTIARNLGAGVHNQSGVFFENTLLAENPGGSCTGSAPAFGAFNLEDTNTCGFVASAGMPNFPNTAPLLGPLQNNGGPTPTMALLPGSPAIDVVTSEIRMNCEMMRDQRGYPRGRPRTDNGGQDVFLCDLGAFEVTQPFVVDSLLDAVDADFADDLCQTAALTCTLRAAIQQANQIPGMNEIELGAGTYSLTIGGTGEDAAATGDLDIDPPMWIRGAGASLTQVHGQDIDRVFDVGAPDHTLNNAPDQTLLQDLEITGGDAETDNGGGIAARRSVRLDGVSVFDNYANRGSGISTSTTGFSFGSEDTIVELFESSVASNTGGMALFAGDARIESSSLIDNINTILGNGGAGEFVRLQLVNSTVSGNTAGASAAFFAQQAVIESSTLYDNTAQFSPGGVFLIELSILSNSIIAGNLAGGTPDNCSSNLTAITTLGHNVTDTPSPDCLLTALTDQTSSDPLLAALADNGGPTPTHLPSAGSPAIDTGDVARCPVLDQRGLPRPFDGDTNGSVVCDVGAIEVPEPGALLSLLAGAAVLMLLERRRR